MVRITFNQYKESAHRNTSGYDEAKKRFLRTTGYTKIPKHTHIHHIDWDRTNGDPDNMFFAVGNEQESKLHHQMMNYVTQSYRAKLLKFDKRNGEYYTDDPYLTWQLEQQQRIAA